MSGNKRASEYKHGQPGQEWEVERTDEQAEPKRATAAQLASRKIKTLKGPRRHAGASSGLSAFNPNPPSASSFNFGPDPNASAGASNPFAQQQSTPGGSIFGQSQQQNASGGNLFAFGSNSTSSFPPAQPPTANSPFAASTNSSFPPASGFGGNNAGTPSTFNTQPDLSFGNTTTSFSASTPANGFTFGAQPAQQPTFGASQNNATNTSASNGFNFLGTAKKDTESNPASGGLFNNNNASTSTPSAGLFSTNSNTQNNTFGGFGSNTNTNSTASASASASATPFGNPFGNLNNTSTSASPFQFGATTQPATTAQDNASTPKALFGEISAAVQASSSETPKPLFSSISGAPQTNSSSEAAKPLFGSITDASSQAPATPFGSNNATKGGSTLFGASTPGNFTFGAQSNGPNVATASTQGEAAATPAPATPAFTFGNSAAKPATPATSNNLFGNLAASTQQDSTSTPAPASFGGFGQTSESQSSSVPATVGGLFSQSQRQAPTATPVSKPSNVGSSTVPAKKRALFGAFGTNQPDTDSVSTEASKNELAVTETASLFGSQFQKPASLGAPANTEPTQSEKPAQNPFASLSFPPASTQKPTQQPAASSPSNSLFQTSKPVTSTPTPAPSATTASTEDTSKNNAVPQVPRVTVPPNWTVPDADSENLREHTALLEQVNDIYRKKIAQLPARADWSALSKWHWQESSKLKKKIDDLKKQAAAAKGITGDESILSTKRKNDDSTQLESPFKKARGGEAPSTPNAKAPALPSTTPKANPLKPFNLFAGASTQQTTLASNELDSSKAGAGKESESSQTPASQGGFKPNFGTSSSSNATGFKPNFGTSASTGGTSSGGFFGQFGGKTKEQLRDERMKKALEEGYESPTTSEEAEGDYETREQWLARWNREEDERQAALDAAANNTTFKFAPTATGKKTDTPSFKFTAASSNTPSTSDGIAASQGLASGASTPGFLSSGIGSPAPSSEGARSVLDTPLGAQTPSSNLFGHLSAASSQDQDDTDDEADDESAPQPSVEEDSKKHKMSNAGDTDSEASESLEESMRRKKPATQKPSLFDRITRDNSEAAPDVADKEAAKPSLNAVNSQLFNINGSQTPAPKKPFVFDFAAAAKTAPQSAPPKQSTFAGDQTFKFGDPIKFGSSTNASTPFTITPATPTSASPAAVSATPAKAVNSPFAFLSAVPSAATSAVSSRAATPASDADASGTDSVAVNEEEGQNHVEADKSTLSDEEREEYEVLFEAEQAIANKQIQKEGASKPEWVKIANGRLWILKHKVDHGVLVRLRMKSGAVRVNHRIPPVIRSMIIGANQTQVLTKEAGVKDGKTVLDNVIFAFSGKDKETKQELARTFSDVYNENL